MRVFSVLIFNGREAVSSLRRNGLRTILGLIGVIIGVSSVIAMVSLGEMAKQQARKQFEALGTDLVVIRNNQGQGQSGIGIADALQLADKEASILNSAPRILGNGSFRYGGKEVGYGSIQGVTRAFAGVSKLPLKEGRFVTIFDVNQNYTVVGHTIAEKMLATGTSDLLGELIELNGILFTVIGILDHYEESYALPVHVGANESVFIPITTSRRIDSNQPIDVIIAVADRSIDHETAKSDIQKYLNSVTPQGQFDITTAKELIAQMEQQMGIFTLLLGAVGSISLVVGGIGVMNIMLVSVAERRMEIAIRRALGARKRDIRSQFLIESIILTTAGGIFGTGLGLVATWGISRFTNWDFLISWISVSSGLGTAVGVGLFFGFQPAHQASQLDPIAGLQGN
ncbi:MAG: ABC transporter permease [Rhodobacteraceae bacterium]|nr:ABC transporter permease [Paracoccaceae bacterium]